LVLGKHNEILLWQMKILDEGSGPLKPPLACDVMVMQGLQQEKYFPELLIEQ